MIAMASKSKCSIPSATGAPQRMPSTRPVTKEAPVRRAESRKSGPKTSGHCDNVLFHHLRWSSGMPNIVTAAANKGSRKRQQRALLQTLEPMATAPPGSSTDP